MLALLSKVWSFTTHFPPHQCGAFTLPRKCGVYKSGHFLFHTRCAPELHTFCVIISWLIVCLPVCLIVPLNVCLHVCLIVCPFWLWSVPLVACLCVFLFICLPVVFLPVGLSAYPYACLFVP